MIRSMTGFGAAKGTASGLALSVELRSVNNRYLDLGIKLPRGFLFAESFVKSFLQERIGRGKVDVFFTLDLDEGDRTRIRVNEKLAQAYFDAVGGIGGLLHTLRAGKAVLRLCDDMDTYCPEATVINLGQPVARTTAVFLNRGYRCYGMGRTPMKGANGVDTYAKRLQIAPENLKAETAGLPGFAFLTEIRDDAGDLMPKLKKAAANGELGSLSKRWLGWWDAIPAGDVTDHAEFLPAQPDYIPEEKPEFGESVEKRKERILYMNTVREQGAESREGAMAQLLLLSKAPPVRPMRLALALIRKETGDYPAVTRRNGGEMTQLPREAVIETTLRLKDGEAEDRGIRIPDALAETMAEIDDANRLAARAAMGDPGALREYVETDPALGGLDRLYCQDVVEALIRLNEDMLGEP